MLPFFIAVLIAVTAASSERPAAALEISADLAMWSMISSLFMGSPFKFVGEYERQQTKQSSRIVPSADSAKDHSPGAVPTEGGTCKKLGLACSAERLFKSATTRALGRQFIATAKARVKRSRIVAKKSFRTARGAPVCQLACTSSGNCQRRETRRAVATLVSHHG